MPSDRASIDLANDQFVSGSYSLRNAQEAEAFYQVWADDYEDHMVGELGYCSPRLVAERLIRRLSDTAAEVLDIGCGTGLTSDLLSEHGFRNIDGIDLTVSMLEKARTRGIYRNLIQADLNEPIELPDQSYDAMVSSGTFTCGHVGPEPFDELVRLLRPGGLWSFSIHMDIWEPAGFRATLDRLISQGQLACVEKEPDRFFETLEPAGWFFVYRRL